MEMKLVIREGKSFTQFKVPIKSFPVYKRILKRHVDIDMPFKKSTRYLYFECEGDLLNGENRL